MIILIDSSQGTITVLADNGFSWKFSEKYPYVAKCVIINLCNYIIEYGTNMENLLLAASLDIDAGSASILFFIL